MILTVDHVTRYSDDRPVRGVVQSHRRSRSRFDGQKVIDWQVTVSGGPWAAGFAMVQATGCRGGDRNRGACPGAH